MIAEKSPPLGTPSRPSVAGDPNRPSGAGEVREVIGSFEDIYDTQVDFVWRSARRLGVDDGAADDVVQQVFLVVHKRLGEFEGRSSLKTWIFSILLNVVRSHKRTVRRKSPHPSGQALDPDDLVAIGPANNPHLALERAEASKMIDLLLETLEEEKRVVFVMAELEQMSANEISNATGLDPKAVYSRLRAARVDFERAASALRRRLGEEGRVR